jgi:hypothetical protein
VGPGRYVGALAVVIVFAGLPVRAELILPGSFYIGAEGGWTDLLAVTNEGRPASTAPFAGQDAKSRERFNAGYNVGGPLGYQWDGWRVEADVNHRHNDTHGLQQIVPRNRPGRWAGAERHSLNEMADQPGARV